MVNKLGLEVGTIQNNTVDSNVDIMAGKYIILRIWWLWTSVDTFTDQFWKKKLLPKMETKETENNV